MPLRRLVDAVKKAFSALTFLLWQLEAFTDFAVDLFNSIFGVTQHTKKRFELE